MMRPTTDERFAAVRAFGSDAVAAGAVPFSAWCHGTAPNDVIEAIMLSQQSSISMPMRWVSKRLDSIRKERARSCENAGSIARTL